jgi:hypothetical protein
MAKKNKLHFLIFMVCLILPGYAAFAQQGQYMVFFIDKDTLTYTLDNPTAFLSERAVERRIKQNIPLTYTDLPVNEAYISALHELGAEVYYRTRWFNGVLAELDPEELSMVDSLDFVVHTELVKPKSRGDSRKAGSSIGRSEPVRRDKRSSQLLNLEQNDMLGIDDMHADGFNGEGLLIAVLDGGFRGVDTVSYFRHIFDDGRMLPGYDFVGNSKDVYRYGQHGTEALSCIGAYKEGELEAGAYGADFLLCVTEDVSSEYRIEEYNWLFAAEFADSTGADIISTSLGYTTFNDSGMDYSYEDLDGLTASITNALNMAAEKGMLCVVSAGNEGSGSWRYVSPPADAADVLAVGAVSTGRNKVSFSSFGPTADGRIKPDVSALGLQTVVVDGAGRVTRSNGTSFAAPLIAGFAAGIWEAFPEAGVLEIMDKIRRSGDKALTPDNETGYGIPDYNKIRENYLLPVEELKMNHHFKVFPNPVENSDLFIEPLEGSLEAPLNIDLYSPQGSLVMQKEYTTFNRNSLTLDMRNLSRGVYIMHIMTASASDTLKIIKF